MPALYLAIKASLKRRGLSEKEAETRAAKAFNARRPAGTPPVTRNYEKTANHYEKDKKRTDRGNDYREY
jgi:hypothetical protein